MSESKGCTVYVAELSDGRLYVGFTSNPTRRQAEHSRGDPETWTTHVNPMRRLLHQESYADKGEAIRRERQLKGWTRAKKLALAEGRLEDLKRLALRRSRSAT